ncbi:MAG: hypothetical protein U5K84_01220 [Alkalibacterium sp.]|nr:hypothetical protein [Alkalibacterium sp.]
MPAAEELVIGTHDQSMASLYGECLPVLRDQFQRKRFLIKVR